MSKHGRVTTAKEEAFIQSLQTKIESKNWVKEALMCDDSLVEQANIEDNSILLVDTKDDYEIIIDIDNQNQTASIRDSFKKIGKKYTVKYDSNGGNGNLDEQEVRAGFSVTLKENSFTKEDYHFVGWSEQKSTGETIYSAGSKYRPEKDVTLYAIWSKDIVTISFNANSAQGTMENLEVEKNTETKLPENTYTKEGFNFVSWNTNQDGTGTSYNNGDNITIKENTTLYAIWEENVTATVQVSNNKITEGTQIEIGATALGSSIQNVELKLGDNVIYTKNVNSKTYTEKISIDKLSNLINLEFYNDYTLNLKVTSTTNKVKEANAEAIKNYTIGTAENLKKLATLTNEGNAFSGETILQIANINLSTVCSSSIGSWTPIGQDSKEFKGMYNGSNYEITNMYINANKERQGLFGYIKDNAVVKNIIVKGIIENSNRYTGGIVGFVKSSVVSNCINYANINIVYPETYANTGGIAGLVRYNSSIEKCRNYGNITSEKRYIGGVVGSIWDSNVRIEECINHGAVISNGSIWCALGGIAGEMGNSQIYRCINYGKVECNSTASSNIAGIVARINNNNTGEIYNCYNSGEIKIVKGVAMGIGPTTDGDLTIENCYNIGTLSGATLKTIASYDASKQINITNCYYLNTCGATGDGTSKTSAELMNLASILGSEWTNDVKDTSGKWKYNKGYPILKWQLNSSK